ncbi:hypothetical protein BKA93DRAFT_488891 [Sparassis latifolia]
MDNNFLTSVMQRIFPTGQVAADDEKEFALQVLRSAIPSAIKSFHGSVHCEASLMAIKAAANASVATSGIGTIFCDIDNVIGVGKKYRNLAVPGQDCFILPGTHGWIFPWSSTIRHSAENPRLTGASSHGAVAIIVRGEGIKCQCRLRSVIFYLC